MDQRQKTNLISLAVLIVCILTALLVYLYTGIVFIAIIFVPPVVHWMLKRGNQGHGTE